MLENHFPRMIIMGDIELIRLFLKYQIWMFKISLKYGKSQDKFLEYTKYDVSQCQYSTLIHNYEFFKCDTHSKKELVKLQRNFVRLLVGGIRKEYGNVKADK